MSQHREEEMDVMDDGCGTPAGRPAANVAPRSGHRQPRRKEEEMVEKGKKEEVGESESESETSLPPREAQNPKEAEAVASQPGDVPQGLCADEVESCPPTLTPATAADKAPRSAHTQRQEKEQEEEWKQEKAGFPPGQIANRFPPTALPADPATPAAPGRSTSPEAEPLESQPGVQPGVEQGLGVGSRYRPLALYPVAGVVPRSVNPRRVEQQEEKGKEEGKEKGVPPREAADRLPPTALPANPAEGRETRTATPTPTNSESVTTLPAGAVEQGVRARSPAADPDLPPRRTVHPRQEEEGEEISLPPRVAHQLPPRPTGGRAVQSFDIPRHVEGSSRVFSRMRAESRGRLNSGTGKTFEAYATNISRFIHRCGLVAREHGLEFDGDVRTVAPVVAKHGQEVYQPVIDAMQRVKNSSPRSQATCIDAFIYLCNWLKGNMGSTPEAVNLMVLMDQVSVKQAQKHKAEANRLQRQRQAQVSVETMQEDGRWITQPRLQRLGAEAYAHATKRGAIIARQKREGKAVAPNLLSGTTAAVVATVVIGAHTSRQGPMSQLSAADMESVLAAASQGGRFVSSGQHKNSAHEETATISMDFNHPKVQEVLRLYQGVLRPLLVEASRSRKNADGSAAATNVDSSSADVTGHFWITRNNTPMNFGKVFSRYVEKVTRGEAGDGVSGLRIGTTAVRRTIATTVEENRRQGKLSSAEAELVHRADGHSKATAVKYYAIGAQEREQAAAGALLSRLGLSLSLDAERASAAAGRPAASAPGAASAAAAPAAAVDSAPPKGSASRNHRDDRCAAGDDDENGDDKSMEGGEVESSEPSSPPPSPPSPPLLSFPSVASAEVLDEDGAPYMEMAQEPEQEQGQGSLPRPVHPNASANFSASAAAPPALALARPTPVRSPSSSWLGGRRTHDATTPSFWTQMAYDVKDPDSPHWARDENGARVPLGDGSGRYKETWFKGAERSVPPSPPLPLRSPNQKRMAYTNEESYRVRWWQEKMQHKYPSPQALWDALELKLKTAKESGKASDPWDRAFGPTHRTSKALKDHAARGMKSFDWGGTLTEEGRAGRRRQLRMEQMIAEALGEEDREDEDGDDEADNDEGQRQKGNKRPREVTKTDGPEGRAAADGSPAQPEATQSEEETDSPEEGRGL